MAYGNLCASYKVLISPWFDPIVCLDKHLPLLDHQGTQRIFLDDAPWRTNTEANSLLVKLSRTSHQFGHGLRNPQVLEMVLNLMLHVSSYLLQGWLLLKSLKDHGVLPRSVQQSCTVATTRRCLSWSLDTIPCWLGVSWTALYRNNVMALVVSCGDSLVKANTNARRMARRSFKGLQLYVPHSLGPNLSSCRSGKTLLCTQKRVYDNC